jgi:hypothetical protein
MDSVPRLSVYSNGEYLRWPNINTEGFLRSCSFLAINKELWEEPIAYFPWYDTSHIENDASNNSSIVVCIFVTAVTFLPGRCLATMEGFLPGCCLATTGGYTDIHTHILVHKHARARAKHSLFFTYTEDFPVQKNPPLVYIAKSDESSPHDIPLKKILLNTNSKGELV